MTVPGRLMWNGVREAYEPTLGDPLDPVLAKTTQVSGMLATTLPNGVSKSTLPVPV